MSLSLVLPPPSFSHTLSVAPSLYPSTSSSRYFRLCLHLFGSFLSIGSALSFPPSACRFSWSARFLHLLSSLLRPAHPTAAASACSLLDLSTRDSKSTQLSKAKTHQPRCLFLFPSLPPLSLLHLKCPSRVSLALSATAVSSLLSYSACARKHHFSLSLSLSSYPSASPSSFPTLSHDPRSFLLGPYPPPPLAPLRPRQLLQRSRLLRTNGHFLPPQVRHVSSRLALLSPRRRPTAPAAPRAAGISTPEALPQPSAKRHSHARQRGVWRRTCAQPSQRPRRCALALPKPCSAGVCSPTSCPRPTLSSPPLFQPTGGNSDPSSMAEPMKMQLINMIPMIGTATLVGHVFSGFVISMLLPRRPCRASRQSSPLSIRPSHPRALPMPMQFKCLSRLRLPLSPCCSVALTSRR